MIFQQLFEPVSCTYSYLIGSERSRESVIIDPVASELDFYLQIFAKNDLKLCYSIETHVHADHISAAALLRTHLGAKVVIHRHANVNCADIYVSHGAAIRIGDFMLEARHTPGHSPACTSFLLDNMLFTGDCLLIDGCGRTDFPEGDAAQLYDSIHQQIFSLSDDVLIYPAHDYQGRLNSSVGHERRYNSRLGFSRSKADFIQLMHNLDLPLPQQMPVALPANLHCGASSSSP